MAEDLLTRHLREIARGEVTCEGGRTGDEYYQRLELIVCILSSMGKEAGLDAGGWPEGSFLSGLVLGAVVPEVERRSEKPWTRGNWTVTMLEETVLSLAWIVGRKPGLLVKDPLSAPRAGNWGFPKHPVAFPPAGMPPRKKSSLVPIVAEDDEQ